MVDAVKATGMDLSILASRSSREIALESFRCCSGYPAGRYSSMARDLLLEEDIVTVKLLSCLQCTASSRVTHAVRCDVLCI